MAITNTKNKSMEPSGTPMRGGFGGPAPVQDADPAELDKAKQEAAEEEKGEKSSAD